MQKKPTLLILAAGLGSRYGSLKQIDRIGTSGERIIDYSVYDAVKAGFGKIVYVIRESFAEEFKNVILKELPKEIETEVVFQELDKTPNFAKFSKKREKPWGTGHALLMAKEVITSPFAVINADDFYGAESFQIAAKFLSAAKEVNAYALIGYKLKNTLSQYGSVSRGICDIDKYNNLTSIVERTKIIIKNSKNLYLDENNTWQILTGNEITSMNMFAFTQSVFSFFEKSFEKFFLENMNNLKAEFFMPTVIGELIMSNRIKVKLLETNANWFGLTYAEDKIIAKQRISELVKSGIYPNKLWI